MILVVNGPNLNLLGEREPEVYGRSTLEDIDQLVRDACAAWDVEVKTFQSNHEGAIIDFLQEHRKRARGIIINPGALTHTSYSLHDCLKAIPVPAESSAMRASTSRRTISATIERFGPSRCATATRSEPPPER